MGIEPHRWGPHVWATIHLCCIGAPVALDPMQQQQYRAFIMSLPHVIPCTTCSEHFQKVLESIPVDNHLTGKDDLFRWSVEVHNAVNARLDKPKVAYDDALQHWKRICDNVAGSGSGSADSWKTNGGIGIVPIIGGILLLYLLIAYAFL